MPILRINKFDLPLRPETVRVTPVEIGETTRGSNGAMRTSRRATKREWQFETALLSASDAAAWRGLLQGRGDYWSLDASTTSATGLIATSATKAATQTTIFRTGTGALHLQQGATGGTSQITWSVPVGTTYSIALWRWGGASWQHWLWRSDGAKWLDGVRNDAAVPGNFSTTTSTTFALLHNGTGDRYYDDLFIVPYLVPSTWAATITANPTTAFPMAPSLLAEGDIISGSTATDRANVVGSVRTARYAQGASSEYEAALQSLSVTLQEV